MRKLLLVLLFLSATVAASAQTPKTPIEYNDKMASYVDTMFSSGQQWGKVFNEAYTSGDYAALKIVTDNMNTYINRSISNINNMQDLKNSKPLRISVIDFLQFERTLIKKAFRPFEKFNSNTPKDTVQAAIDYVIELSKQEEQFLKKVEEVQKKYGLENGFKIEEKEEDNN